MRYLLILLLTLPVQAAEFEQKTDCSVVITLTKQEMLECAKEGGCAIISMKGIEEVAKNAAANMCGRRI